MSDKFDDVYPHVTARGINYGNPPEGHEGLMTMPNSPADADAALDTRIETMADKIDDGGPAFPLAGASEYQNEHDFYPHQDGMSLRDWFAGQALSNPEIFAAFMPGMPNTQDKTYSEMIAERACTIADAVVKRLK